VRKSASRGAQLVDERRQRGVAHIAAGLHPQSGDALAGHARPVGVEPEIRVEEGQPDQVALFDAGFR
jgi:hypothetical protein